jgi:hypothetical protein
VSQSSRASVASSESSVAAEEGVNAYSSDEEAEVAALPRPDRQLSVLHRPSAATYVWRAIGRVRALADYTAGDTNELSLEMGHVLVVSGVNEFGWWRGCRVEDETAETVKPHEIGWFPCTYVEWIYGTELFQATRAHSVDDTGRADGQLQVAVGDSVDVLKCDWRDDRLWAFGTVGASGRQGWFPFSCVVDKDRERV